MKTDQKVNLRPNANIDAMSAYLPQRDPNAKNEDTKPVRLTDVTIRLMPA
jgi:hypothetical protein